MEAYSLTDLQTTVHLKMCRHVCSIVYIVYCTCVVPTYMKTKRLDEY